MAALLRNVAIIAHVDHGKTTLVDAMLRQSGAIRASEARGERLLDSNALERERGITIFAKHCTIRCPTSLGEVRLTIIDTPGHADFGGEVERTLRMADGSLLLVDAAEGPLPQTRFVLKHALDLGHRIIVVINKIDRPDARPEEVLGEIFDLFIELGASDEQADFPVLYAIGKEGIAKRSLHDENHDLTPLFETIAQFIPPPRVEPDAPFAFLVHDIQADDYVGRLAIGRIAAGKISEGQQVIRIGKLGTSRVKVGFVYAFDAMRRIPVPSAQAGEIVALSGIEGVEIGDTLCAPEHPRSLPRIHVEEPTLKLSFYVNTSPFAGQSGRFLTSRHLRERLEREALRNIAMRFEPAESPDEFIVYGRGELMIAILLETMRREGYELAVGMPEPVLRESQGQLLEPIEHVVIDLPEAFFGTVTGALSARRGELIEQRFIGNQRIRLEFRIPSRGLIGYRSQLMSDTRGTGTMHSIFAGWAPYSGPMNRRSTGALVADRQGICTAYALDHLQARGTLFVSPGDPVYEGMIVGEHNRENDLNVNVTREKKLSNIRMKNKDENIILTPPRRITLEFGLEFIDRDELMEVTPAAIRLRKKVLEASRRPTRNED
ncbi:MAG: translational GTPase TypA [Sandaracinaceae bacterium]|nr:translational GTPase TypA [Sandaracinaceae bacterium]